jgi:hypothetical protein
MIYTSKKALIEDMKKNMDRPEVALRAMLRVYQNQTKDERLSKQTTHQNGVGFTKTDVEILSSFSSLLQHGCKLSEKQTAVAIRRMKKYAAQIVEGSIKEQKILYHGGKYYTNADIVKAIKMAN